MEDVFTAEETARLRLAINNARIHLRGWKPLAAAMGVHVDTVRGAGRYRILSAGVAYRFARAIGTTIEVLIAPGLRVVEPRPGPDGAS